MNSFDHFTAPKYRPDIDGLRGIAVLSVVFYHTFPTTFAGGFVGVDIFFVISGFLISSIIFGNLAKASFSFTEFYTRRIRRIFPALILVLATCYVLGWLVLLPDEYKQLGKHIAGGSFFFSNIMLWKETGYFDTIAALKPLLHLWSLGIEEQFYILWPFTVFWVWKRKWNIFRLILIVLGISFWLNIKTIHVHPTSAFYLPGPRFWELLTGSLLAHHVTLGKMSRIDEIIATTSQRVSSNRLNMLCNLIAATAMIVLCLVILGIWKMHPFPGWWALLPTLSAIALISMDYRAWVNRNILSCRPIVWIGLISYPLYLWHWPLLAFTRTLSSGESSYLIRVTTVFISILLAWMTYRFVEHPIRFGLKGIKTSIPLCLILGVLGCLGFVTYKKDGFPTRFANYNTKIADLSIVVENNYQKCPDALNSEQPQLRYCLQSSPTLPTMAIWGDSHADHIFHGIAKLDKNRSWLLVGNNSCPPTSDIEIKADNPNCKQINSKVINYLSQSSNINTVVLSFFGNYIAETNFAAEHVRTNFGPKQTEITSDKFKATNKQELFYMGLLQAVSELEQTHKKVIIVIDIPELPFSPRDCIHRPYLLSDVESCTQSREAVLNRQKEIRTILTRIQFIHPKMRLYDPLSLMCDDKTCYMQTSQYLLYRDSHHLSLRGGELFAKSFLNWLDASH